MRIVCAHVHRRQISYAVVDVGSGEMSRGRITPATRQSVRDWLAQFNSVDHVHFALEGTTRWRFAFTMRLGAAAFVGSPRWTGCWGMQSREERIARNDATFRAANEQIADYASDHEFVDQVPFICECATESCLVVVDLSLAEYEEVRSSPTRFFVAAGHQATEGQLDIVDDRGRYVLVEKGGRAGEVARDLDPRSPAR